MIIKERYDHKDTGFDDGLSFSFEEVKSAASYGEAEISFKLYSGRGHIGHLICPIDEFKALCVRLLGQEV